MKIAWTILAFLNAIAVLGVAASSPGWDWWNYFNLIFTFGSAYAAGAAK